MDHAGEKLKWAETIYITHGPAFGHKIYLATQVQGQDPNVNMDWSWRGLGVPAEIVKSAQAYVGAVLEEYLVWRYGVADVLDYGNAWGSPTF